MQQIYRRTTMARCDFNKVVNTFVANTVVAMKLKTHFTVELPKYFALENIQTIKLCFAEAGTRCVL